MLPVLGSSYSMMGFERNSAVTYLLCNGGSLSKVSNTSDVILTERFRDSPTPFSRANSRSFASGRR